MTAPSLTVTIDRSSLSLSDLVFNGDRSGARGIVKYNPPAMLARVAYMPDSPSVHGSEATAWSWNQSVLAFDWFPIGAANETAVQAAFDEVVAAISQFKYTVTTQVSGAPAQDWTADPGSINIGGSDGRTFVDLTFLQPVYAVTIPVYPVSA